MNNTNNTNSTGSAKKIFIILAIAGIIMTVVGGAILVGAFAMGGWDFTQFDNEVLTPAEFTADTPTGDIDSVILEGNWRFSIVRGEQFSVTYYESDLFTITAEANATSDRTDGKTFHLREQRDGWFNIGINGVRRQDKTVVVTLVEGHEYDIKIIGSSSRTTIVNQDFYSITLGGASSRLNLTQVNVLKDISVTGSSSKMEFKQVTANQITLGGANITAEFDTVTVTQDINLTGSSSKIEFKQVSATSISLSGASITANIDTVTLNQNLTSVGSSVNINIVNSSMRIIDTSGASVTINVEKSDILAGITQLGSNTRINLKNITVQKITTSGSSVRVVGENIDIGGFESLSGSSTTVELSIVGSVGDILSVTANGSNSRVTVDGTSHGSAFVNQGGSKTFSTNGASTRIVLTTLGGESIF